MNKIIVPTGYMGSGSSAFVALISEFQGYEAKNENFEYVFLHCPDGLFDLEDKLFHGNNALRSDEALHTFYNRMKILYDKKYYWVGNYKKRVGEDFLKITDTFIQSITQYREKYYWYPQEQTNANMFCKLVLNKLVYVLSFKHIKLKKPLLYPETWITYIDAPSFYEQAQQYVARVMELLGASKQNIVLDQLLLPYNLHRIDHYFNDEIRAIVVDRDPRDVFITNKYIWTYTNESVPFPLDVKAFCKFYKDMRQCEKSATNEHIYRFHFEDLIYHYEETLAMLYDVLEVCEVDHVTKLTQFQPEKSIDNTQLYLANETYRAEAAIIAEELSEYLYEFPYERIPNEKNTF